MNVVDWLLIPVALCVYFGRPNHTTLTVLIFSVLQIGFTAYLIYGKGYADAHDFLGYALISFFLGMSSKAHLGSKLIRWCFIFIATYAVGMCIEWAIAGVFLTSYYTVTMQTMYGIILMTAAFGEWIGYGLRRLVGYSVNYMRNFFSLSRA